MVPEWNLSEMVESNRWSRNGIASQNQYSLSLLFCLHKQNSTYSNQIVASGAIPILTLVLLRTEMQEEAALTLGMLIPPTETK